MKSPVFPWVCEWPSGDRRIVRLRFETTTSVLVTWRQPPDEYDLMTGVTKSAFHQQYVPLTWVTGVSK